MANEMPAIDGDTRLLIVTGSVVADVAELPPLIRTLISSASEIVVIAPVLPGRLQWLASDTDRVRQEADERLKTVVDHAFGWAGSISGPWWALAIAGAAPMIALVTLTLGRGSATAASTKPRRRQWTSV